MQRTVHWALETPTAEGRFDEGVFSNAICKFTGIGAQMLLGCLEQFHCRRGFTVSGSCCSTGLYRLGRLSTSLLLTAARASSGKRSSENSLSEITSSMAQTRDNATLLGLGAKYLPSKLSITLAIVSPRLL